MSEFARYLHLIRAVAGQEWKEWKPGRIKFRCPFRDQHKNEDRNWSGYAQLGDGRPGGFGLLLRCAACGAQTKDYIGLLGLPIADFFPEPPGGPVGRPGRRPSMSTQPHPTPVARYDYCDPDGHVIATKVRLEPGWQGRVKDFTWERPLTAGQMDAAGLAGDEGYTSGTSAGWFAPTGAKVDGRWQFVPDPDRKHPRAVELPRVAPQLFRLPELLAAPPARPVFVVEGEKDVLTLEAIGFLAVCGPHGKTVWWESWGDWFRGRKVVVIPDNDGPGILHGKSVVGTIVCGGAAAVKFLTPGQHGYHPPADGGDVTDWLTALPVDVNRATALREVCALTPSYQRSAVAA